MERITVSPAEARRMILDGTAPANMRIDGALHLSGCTALTALPAGLSVAGWLHLSGCTALTAMPEGLTVGGSLYLFGCTALTRLPDGLTVGGTLYLSGFTALTRLPEGLTVGDCLDLYGCTELTELPQRITINGITGRMIAHSDYPLIWDGARYHAGCRHLTPCEALEHWGHESRTDARARIFLAAIRAHQRELNA